MVHLVLTTSPIKSNPQLDMITTVAAGLMREPLLQLCPFILVCDGPAAALDAAGRARYGAFVAALRARAAVEGRRSQDEPFAGARVLALPSQQGFSFALKAALAELEPAPGAAGAAAEGAAEFVVVAQHDWLLTRAFGLNRVLEAMVADEGVNYVTLMSDTGRGYAAKTRSRGGWYSSVDLAPRERSERGLRLLPSLNWYGKLHVAQRSFYSDVVFASPVLLLLLLLVLQLLLLPQLLVLLLALLLTLRGGLPIYVQVRQVARCAAQLLQVNITLIYMWGSLLFT